MAQPKPPSPNDIVDPGVWRIQHLTQLTVKIAGIAFQANITDVRHPGYHTAGAFHTTHAKLLEGFETTLSWTLDLEEHFVKVTLEVVISDTDFSHFTVLCDYDQNGLQTWSVEARFAKPIPASFTRTFRPLARLNNHPPVLEPVAMKLINDMAAFFAAIP